MVRCGAGSRANSRFAMASLSASLRTGIRRPRVSNARDFGNFAMRAASCQGSAPERAMADTMVSGAPLASSHTTA